MPFLYVEISVKKYLQKKKSNTKWFNANSNSKLQLAQNDNKPLFFILNLLSVNQNYCLYSLSNNRKQP